MKNKEEVQKETEVTKVRQKSESYALKAIITHLETITEAELITRKERGVINEILTKAVNIHILQKYGLQGK